MIRRERESMRIGRTNSEKLGKAWTIMPGMDIVTNMAGMDIVTGSQ